MAHERHVRMRALPAIVGAAAVLLAGPAWSGDADRGSRDRPATDLERLIERELDRAFDHLQGALETLPRYALPEVTEEGDIIIRRLPRPPNEWPARPDDRDDTVDL